MKKILFSLLLFLPLSAAAQATWSEFVEHVSSVTTTDAEDKSTAELLEEWEELHLYPQNINAITRDELLRLPFLDEAATDSILLYRDRKGSLLSLGELQFISRVSYDARYYLPLFLVCEPLPKPAVPFFQLFREGKNELDTRFDIPLYSRKGFAKETPDERRYLGNALHHVLRFRHRNGKRLDLGVTMEKDAGEPFASNVQTDLGKRSFLPYDFLSFHFTYRTPKGQEFYLGDFRLRTGQGLLLGSGSFNSKAQLFSQSSRSRTTLSPYYSIDEYHFFRGAATRLVLPLRKPGNVLSLMAFGSFRQFDARLKGDSITSFSYTGLHRTQTEIARRRAVDVLTAGGNLSFDNRTTHLGITGYYTHFSRQIAPTLRDYNRYQLRGNASSGISADYAFRLGEHWSAAGEWAFDAHWNYATTHTIRYQRHNSSDALTFFLQERSVSQRFVSPFGTALMENTRVENEHGLLLGTSFALPHHLQMTAYIDAFYFPAARFRALPSSKGMEAFASARLRPRRNVEYLFSYKFKTKEQTITGYDLMEFRSVHTLSAQMFFTGKRHTLVPTLRAVFNTRQTGENNSGILAALRSTLRFSDKWRGSAFGSYFYTSNSNTRIYAYEPQLRYAGGFSSFADHGVRFLMQGEWQCTPHLRLSARFATLHLFNRPTIGSDLQEINSSWKNDVSVQLLWKF